jgi:urea transport system substrate-binding protein
VTQTPADQRREPLRIGLIYSLTGPLSVTEASIHRGAVLAAEEINAAGGVNGREIVTITEDYASDIPLATARALKLVRDDRVHVCVGGYTSASRIAMLPVFRRHNAVFVYSTYYEGLERDENTFYAGAVPNQFLDEYLRWVVDHLGSRLYVVGSDYVYPRTLGVIIQRLARTLGAEVLAERYVPLGTTEFRSVIEEIEAIRPDVVVSNVVGSDSVPALYRQFHAAGHRAETLPIAATVTTEIEVQAMGPEYNVGHYMTATYFGSLDGEQNRRYVEAFRARFGPEAVTHVPQVGAYNAVRLVGIAAARAADLTPPALRESLLGARFDGNPEGWPTTISANHHTDHPSYIGRGRADGQFDVLASFPPRPPDPFPPSIVHESRRGREPTM